MALEGSFLAGAVLESLALLQGPTVDDIKSCIPALKPYKTQTPRALILGTAPPLQ